MRQSRVLSALCVIACLLGAAVSLGASEAMAQTAASPQTWSWRNPLPQGNDLSAVHFADANTGWTVGLVGTILKTADGGTTWAAQTSGTANHLSSVYFVDANTGWAVGSFGTILKTNNGGATWARQSAGTLQTLRSVRFINANTGWAVGSGYGSSSVILHTTDGGATWVPQISSTYNHLSSVHFIDASNGWVVGGNVTGGAILKTTDGGRTWTSQVSGTTQSLSSVDFVDANTGWAVGSLGIIVHTTNGGATWTPQNSGTRSGLDSVHFTDANTGWAVGGEYCRVILHTTNGGATWTPQTSGTTQELHSVHFTDAKTGWAVGYLGSILHTKNGGATWRSQSSGTTNGLGSVQFVDATTGWAVGGATILKTTNGGTTWTPQASGTTNRLSSVHFTNRHTGWAVGKSGTILKSTDGGATWTPQTSGTTEYLLSVHFTDTNTGWAVGSAGTILKTTDGGSTWTQQTSGTTKDLNSVAFTDAHTGWVAGDAGTILKTTDGGATWKARTLGTTDDLYDVHFVNAKIGWAVGGHDYRGTILKTTDGGTTWTPQTAATWAELMSVDFADANTGWAIGEYGLIIHTANGGATWTAQIPVTTNHLWGVRFSDTKTGWVVGGGGTILKLPEVPWTDPVPVPSEPGADYLTSKPILVCLAGLNSNTALDGGQPFFFLKQAAAQGLLPAVESVHVVPSWPGGAREGWVVASDGALDAQAERLAEYLRMGKSSFEGHPVILVGHSYGGVIARAFVSDGQLLRNSELERNIAGVIQLGSPNEGSQLATALYYGTNDDLRWMLGAVIDSVSNNPQSEAVRTLIPSQMSSWNRQRRTRKPVWRVAGNFLPEVLDEIRAGEWQKLYGEQSGWDHVMSSGSRSGWEDLQARTLLDALDGQRNDGFVTVDSVIGRPDPDLQVRMFGEGSRYWIEDHVRHGHKMPGAYSVTQHYSWLGYVDSLKWRYNPEVVPEWDGSPVLPHLYEAIGNLPYAGFAATGGRKVGVTSREAAAPSSPAGGDIPSRQVAAPRAGSASVTLGLGKNTVLYLTSDVATPTLEVISPAGLTVIRRDSATTSDGHRLTRVELSRPAPGSSVVGISLEGGAPGTVGMSGKAKDGPALTLRCGSGEALAGSNQIVTATLTDTSGPSLGAHVSLRWTSPGGTSATVALRDDGASPDAAPGDGIYSGRIALSGITGTWKLEATATGPGFERWSAGLLRVGSPGWARFAGPAVLATTPGPGSTVATIGLSVPVSANVEGAYVIRAELADASGAPVDFPVARVHLDAGTSTVCRLDTPAALLAGLAPGKLSYRNLRLYRTSQDGGLIADTDPGLVTPAFDGGDFYDFSVSLAPRFSSPTCSATVVFHGSARYTPAKVASVDYSIDGGSRWTSATPTDGRYDSPSEDFSVSLTLSDGVYGLLARATASDGSTLPPGDWDGTRFIVDTAAPKRPQGLKVSRSPVDPRMRQVSWTPPESASPSRATVRYALAIDGAPIGETYGHTYDLTLPSDNATHSVSVLPVDEAGNAGPASTMLVAPPPRTFDSVEGAGRYDTAVQASRRAFPASGSADTIVLATGANWPDALGGASLAGAYGGPLLLTKPDVLSGQVLDEARRLNVGRVIILGSTRAVSAAVENALKAATVNGHRLTVSRIGGAGRYDTAARIASATVDAMAPTPWPYDGTAFFATGGNFPDALAASPIAAAYAWPILLVQPNSPSTFTEAAITKLGVKKGYMLGSTRAVSTKVEARLKTLLRSTPARLAGTTRYDTGIAIAKFGVGSGLHWDGVAIATGTNFPDALAGGVMQGKLGSVVLLTPGRHRHRALPGIHQRAHAAGAGRGGGGAAVGRRTASTAPTEREPFARALGAVLSFPLVSAPAARLTTRSTIRRRLHRGRRSGRSTESSACPEAKDLPFGP
jgi:photosystem II stability/assembly factor-like uncharacterized protein/putative cell wall-binding protein